jgi:esterase/lipase superfamily enzyme
MRISFLLVLALLSACATVAPPASQNYAVVRTFYATDRNRTGSIDPKQMFGTERATLSYGTCEISIPRLHRPGELESPSIRRFELREDPEKHVVLLSASVVPKEAYFEQLRASVSQAARSRAFVFVHGYNVTFEDAARRTAQISYDVGFDGVPVFYSWASQGTTAGYPRDEESIQLTMPHLQEFLEDFFARSSAQDVYLVAHSMGNRALTSALARLLEARPEIRSRLKEIILSAPDINVDIFKEQIYPALARANRPITLYASSEDVALSASKQFHGYQRLGESRPIPVLLAGIETIDATGVDVSFLKHSYFAEAAPLLTDLRKLILQGARANTRSNLTLIRTGSMPYWAFTLTR